jgi:hypothetical protein
MILMGKFTHQLGKTFPGEDLHPAGIGHLRGRPGKHHPLRPRVSVLMDGEQLEMRLQGCGVYAELLPCPANPPAGGEVGADTVV